MTVSWIGRLLPASAILIPFFEYSRLIRLQVHEAGGGRLSMGCRLKAVLRDAGIGQLNLAANQIQKLILGKNYLSGFPGLGQFRSGLLAGNNVGHFFSHR